MDKDEKMLQSPRNFNQLLSDIWLQYILFFNERVSSFLCVSVTSFRLWGLKHPLGQEVLKYKKLQICTLLWWRGEEGGLESHLPVIE